MKKTVLRFLYFVLPVLLVFLSYEFSKEIIKRIEITVWIDKISEEEGKMILALVVTSWWTIGGYTRYIKDRWSKPWLNWIVGIFLHLLFVLQILVLGVYVSEKV